MLLCSESEKALTIVRVSGVLLELQLRWVLFWFLYTASMQTNSSPKFHRSFAS